MFRRVSAFAVIVALGLMLTGCDKCGDWFWQQKSAGPQTCKGSLPQQ